MQFERLSWSGSTAAFTRKRKPADRSTAPTATRTGLTVRGFVDPLRPCSGRSAWGVEEKGSDVENESVIFKVYSDGSGMTGGPAGIGFVAYVDDELLLRGNLPVASATNQQAELRAAAFALNSIPEGQDVELLSDSEYVVNGYNEYLPRWRERGWRNSGGGAVANHALWEELIGAVKRHRNVRFEWTKGHDGTEGNEHAHRLASQARRVAEGVDWLDVVPPAEPPTLP